MYISEIITKEERKKWKTGDSIFITSPTGSGKSYFVTDVMAKDGGEILLISNRKLLRQQNSLAVQHKENVHTINYQGLIEIPNIYSYLENFDILVFDEIQFVFSDDFTRVTDRILKLLTKPSPNHINLFITATPEVIQTVNCNFDYQYNFKVDYSYVEEIYEYDHASSVDRILHSIPDGEKCLYFCSSAKSSYELNCKYADSAFLCSEHNKNFYKNSSMQERANIIAKEKFQSKYLFTTQVLDNGVNLKDRQLKHIIIDMIDPVTFIQCLGRKRIVGDGDTIKLYIRNYNGKTLNGYSTNLRSKLNLAKERWELGAVDFGQKYKKVRLPDIIDNDMSVNEAIYYSSKYYQNLYYTMCVDADKRGYLKYICDKLQKDWTDVKSVEKEFAKVSLLDILNESVGKPLNKEQQRQLTHRIFSIETIGYIKNSQGEGLSTLNGMIIDLSYPFVVESQQVSVGGKRQTLWKVKRKTE